MTLHMQFITMGTMILAGVYVGIALETFRRFKIYLQKSHLLVAGLEICFWITQTGIVFYLLYKVNDGALRLYVFLACILGFSIYQVVFKNIYKQILEIVIKVVYVSLIRPVMWILRAIYMTITFTCKQLIRLLLFSLKVLVFPFKIIFLAVGKIIPKRICTKVTQIYSFCSTMVDNYKVWKK